jgi:hypothetical protein
MLVRAMEQTMVSYYVPNRITTSIGFSANLTRISTSSASSNYILLSHNLVITAMIVGEKLANMRLLCILAWQL